MIMERQQNGLFFQFQETDWKGKWRDLLDWVKSFQVGSQWEYDSVKNEWWICEELVKSFFEMKKRYLDDVLNPNQIDLNL